MQTKSIMLQSLCIPCHNRCHFCLLSYDGKTSGLNCRESQDYAKRWSDWIRIHHLDLTFHFVFGYSMDHPQLLSAIDFMNSIGSVMGEFLQFNGMKLRTEKQVRELLADLYQHAVKRINVTFYGTKEYLDRFAGRTGDFAFLLNTMKQAIEMGFEASAGIAMYKENIDQVNELVSLLKRYSCKEIRLFLHHEEGRGRYLKNLRLQSDDLRKLDEESIKHFNAAFYKTEEEWAKTEIKEDKNRTLRISLTEVSYEHYRTMSFADIIKEMEELDDHYYEVIPSFQELMKELGSFESKLLYGKRDLYYHYQREYIARHHLDLYDVNDERQTGSRRY